MFKHTFSKCVSSNILDSNQLKDHFTGGSGLAKAHFAAWETWFKHCLE